MTENTGDALKASAAQTFAEWLNSGPEIAKAAGIEVDIVAITAEKGSLRLTSVGFDARAALSPQVEQSDRIAALEAENTRLREALTDTRSCIKNARGAVESNQVHDKDVHGTLSRAVTITEAALHGTDRAALSTKGEA